MKGALAISSVLSQVCHYNKHELIKLSPKVCGSKIYSLNIKISFKVFPFLKQPKLAISSDTPHLLFLVGTVLIKLWKITLSFHKFKVLAYLRHNWLSIPKNNILYSSSACLRNMHENVTFVIGKFNSLSYQFVYVLFPLRPKKPFGPQNVATYIQSICKGHLRSWGGGLGTGL